MTALLRREGRDGRLDGAAGKQIDPKVNLEMSFDMSGDITTTWR